MPAAPTEQAPSDAASTPPSSASVSAGAGVDRSEELLLDRAVAEIATPPGAGASGWPARLLGWWPTLVIAGLICFVTFLAGGGLNLAPMTAVEMTLTIASGLVVAAAVLFGRSAGRAYGAWSVALLLAFTALTALSVIWSVQPDDSFKDAGRMLSYCAVFGAVVVLARTIPARWPAVLGGIVLAAVVVCAYALLTKVFPAHLDAGDIYARLRAPYSYWNAIGLTAAMGAIGCMWLGARRTGHAVLSAAAYPAMGLMLLTLLLAYSRGALVSLLLGLALWFCIVPLRLRGAAILISGAIAAGAVVAWDFSTAALDDDNVALAARTHAGHQLGVLVLAMLLALSAVGIAFGFWTSRQAPSIINRRRAGAVLLSLLVLVVLVFCGALAASHRGFAGTISHALHSVTNPHAAVPSNGPGRLTAVGSVRARYWNEALKVFKAHPALGAGAEGYATARLRYRTETLDVRHAHGYIVQTLADLGIAGLVLTLALLFAWMAAAGRSTHPLNRRWTSWRALGDWLQRHPGAARPGWRRLTLDGRPAPYTAERVAMLSMLCLVVVFGIHSIADWTWYVPGDACVALLCAGWLAGRGPLEARHSAQSAQTLSFAALSASTSKPAGTVDLLGAERMRYGVWLPDWRELRARLSPAALRALGATRICIALAAVVGALIAAWAQWQPLRSSNASQQALTELAHDPRGALSTAQTAVSRDPLSAQALFTLSAVQQATGQSALARATLQRAVRLQPSNPQTWLMLGQYDLSRNPAAAVNELGAAIYLNPESVSAEAIAQGNPEAIQVQNEYVQALRAVSAQAEARTARQRTLRSLERARRAERLARRRARAHRAGSTGTER
ncbi:MAG TPA: O-antigen ligase family protein [Solirubrobacteraceae bacterium]|nr:O-antigen ligase family protein [Solirubrobacteraceae bacterium]